VSARVLRDHVALDAEERRGLDSRDDRREGRDRVGDARLLDVGEEPRAGDPVRHLALEEQVLRNRVVDLRADEPFLVPLVDQRRVLQELRIRDTDVRRVEVAGFVRAEDVAAEPGEERVHVVRVTLALLHGEADLRLRLLLRRERLLLEVRKRRRHLRELRVGDQRDVLECDGRAVELLDRGAVRERVERVGGELLSRRGGRRERDDRTVARELADPVVRADDDVRRVVDGNRGDLLADRALLLLHDLDRDALAGCPGVGDLRDRRHAVGVGPDDDLGRLTRRGDAGRDGDDRDERADGEAGSNSQLASTQHRDALLEERDTAR
jgi:hypothetical protein